MKKLLYLLIPLTFASCSDDGSNTPQSAEKRLSKTISLDYQDGVLYYKKVIYYEDGKEALDSLFNGEGVLLMHKSYVHTATATHSTGTNDITGDAISNEILFDADHRMLSITEKHNGQTFFVTTFAYDGVTVLKHTEYADGFIPQDYKFTYGPGGYLTQTVEASGNTGFTIQVASQKPVGYYALQDDIQYFIADIGYYDTAVPEELKSTIDDINNRILWTGDITQSARSGNFYIQSFWNTTFESTFDADNFITSRKETVNQPEPVVNEMFYFYTEE